MRGVFTFLPPKAFIAQLLVFSGLLLFFNCCWVCSYRDQLQSVVSGLDIHRAVSERRERKSGGDGGGGGPRVNFRALT